MPQAQLLPAYLVVGADEVKRDHAIARLKLRLEQTGMADFNLDERDMTKEQDPEELISSLNTFPMGSDFRLVVLYGCDRLPKQLSELLVDYLSNPSPSTVCLVVAKSLAKNTRLYKAIAKIGDTSIIDCAAKKAWELPKQLQEMASRYGASITLSAAEELVSRAGTNTRMLDNELKRLAQQVPSKSIELPDVERIVARTAEVQPWDFLNALSARKLDTSLSLFRLMPAKNYVWLHSLMVARIRELITAKALDARGQARDLARALGMQSWQVKNHVRWSRLFTMDELVGALHQGLEVEFALKGSRDSETALLTWVVSIVGK